MPIPNRNPQITDISDDKERPEMCLSVRFRCVAKKPDIFVVNKALTRRTQGFACAEDKKSHCGGDDVANTLYDLLRRAGQYGTAKI